MTTSELEALVGQRIPTKWQVVTLGEQMLWRQSDGSWIDYEDERRERRAAAGGRDEGPGGDGAGDDTGAR